MSHELSIRDNGFVEMAYFGKPAWHGLGNELLVTDTPEDRRRKAGFDWQIDAAPVHYSVGGEQRTFSDRKVLYRSDSKAGLSIVSDIFKVVQPADVLNYFENLAEKAGFQLETAGVLYDGKQFWGLARIGDEMFIRDKSDLVKSYLLMATSVDLSMPTTFKFVAERVVCHNTLSWGLREAGKTVKIRHNRLLNEREVNEKLGVIAHSGFAQTIDDLRMLAETPVSPLEAIRLTAELIRPDVYQDVETGTVSPEEFDRLMRSAPVQRISDLAQGVDLIGAELAGVSGTAWGWLNGVTQYVDHEARAQTIDGRLHRAWFGAGDKMKARAMDDALRFAKGEPSETQDNEELVLGK